MHNTTERPHEVLFLVYPFDTLRSDDTLTRFQGVLDSHGLVADPDMEKTLVNHRKVPIKHFTLTTHSIDFLQTNNRACNWDSLFLYAPLPLAIPWDEWANALIEGKPFLMGWIVNGEYDHWQNAEDLLHYRIAGKSAAGLPTKSNGLPFPLERTVIDTSANPGRMRIRDGYYEAVGSVMWLGERFCEITGAQKSEVERAEWLRVTHPLPSLLRIEAQSTCFRSDQGVEAELQRKLRSLLFPRTANMDKSN